MLLFTKCIQWDGQFSEHSTCFGVCNLFNSTAGNINLQVRGRKQNKACLSLQRQEVGLKATHFTSGQYYSYIQLRNVELRF